MEIRTPVLTLKGSRPRPLDDGGAEERDGRERRTKAAGFYHPAGRGSSNPGLHPGPERMTASWNAEDGSLGALIQQAHQVKVTAIDEDTRTFDSQAWDKDASKGGAKKRNEFARTIRHQ